MTKPADSKTAPPAPVSARQGQRFDETFKLDAVRLREQTGRPRAQVARDLGSQHTSAAWHRDLRLLRMTSSMSRTANCYDNATMESFWASFKNEAFRAIPASRQQARSLIHDFIDAFYNTRRLHSSLAYQSPIQFESSLTHFLN